MKESERERERQTDRQRPREREREWKGGPEISCPLQSDICSHVLNDCIPSVGDIRITLIAKRKWNYSKSDNVKVGWKSKQFRKVSVQTSNDYIAENVTFNS